MPQNNTTYQVTIDGNGIAVLKQLSDAETQLTQTTQALIPTLQGLQNVLTGLNTATGSLTLNLQNFSTAGEQAIDSLAQQAAQLSAMAQNQAAGDNSFAGGNGGDTNETSTGKDENDLSNALSVVKSGVEGYKTAIDAAKIGVQALNLMNSQAATSTVELGDDALTATPLLEGLGGVLDFTPLGLLGVIIGVGAAILDMGDDADKGGTKLKQMADKGTLAIQEFRHALGDASFKEQVPLFEYVDKLNPQQVIGMLLDRYSADKINVLDKDFEKKYGVTMEQAYQHGFLKATSNYIDPITHIAGEHATPIFTVDYDKYQDYEKKIALSGMYYDPDAKSKTVSHNHLKTYSDYLPGRNVNHAATSIEKPSSGSFNNQAQADNSAAGTKQALLNPIHVEFHNTYNNVQDSLKDIYTKIVEVLTNAVHDSRIGNEAH